MTEREMEDLVWRCPEQLLLMSLKQFRRQARSDVGRSDLIFEDRLGRLVVIELKRGKLPRGAIEQLHDYYGTLKREFPQRPVELIVVANVIPEERRLACERLNIDPVEISEKRFRDIAAEIEYSFESEMNTQVEKERQPVRAVEAPSSRLSFTNKVERAWGYFSGFDRPVFLAFVNAKGNCSVRAFDLNGRQILKRSGSGDFHVHFQDLYRGCKVVEVSVQPALVKAGKEGLPAEVLNSLKRQAGL